MVKSLKDQILGSKEHVVLYYCTEPVRKPVGEIYSKLQ